MSGLGFERPAAWILGVVWLAVVVARRRRPPDSIAFAPWALLPPPKRTWRDVAALLPGLLATLGGAAAVVACAGPTTTETRPAEAESVDVVLCLDVSSSMTAKDMDARRTRLEVAKEAAAAFVDARAGDRVALVTFARYADLRCPFTTDHAALKAILADVAPVARDGPEDATAIGGALAKAARALGDDVKRTRVVALLTDGDENVATAATPEEIAPLHAAQMCADRGVRAYVVAAAGAGESTPGGFAAADVSDVRRAAERTGGRFYSAKDGADVRAVFGEIDRLEKAPLKTPEVVLVSRAAPLVAAAVVLLLLARALRASPIGVLA